MPVAHIQYVKLYPIEKNPLISEGDVSLTKYIAHLTRLRDALPKDQVDDAVVKGHQAVEVGCHRQLTELEVLQARLEAIRQAALGAGRDPLAEQVLALLG